ncbi:putative phosphoglycerate kinase [Helianthus annuus]|nr:putative phosphoglycerate kinase [Helianthus annuus]
METINRSVSKKDDLQFEVEPVLNRPKVNVERSGATQGETSQSGSSDVSQDETSQSVPNLEDYILVRDRSKRKAVKPLRYRDQEDISAVAFVAAENESIYELLTFEEVVNSEDSQKWYKAMDEEMDSLYKNGTWELVNKPKDQKLVSCKWIYKIKEGDKPGGGPRYKARLVAKGFTQKAGVDYNEIFSPVVKHVSIRVILSLVASLDLELEQMDVKTAFLHGNLEEKIYMAQPKGYEIKGQEDKACLLKRSLYGLKQSPRQWYKRFDEYIVGSGFSRSPYDSCVYHREYDRGKFVYLLLYVDDMLITCESKSQIEETKQLLMREFEMKDLGSWMPTARVSFSIFPLQSSSSSSESEIKMATKKSVSSLTEGDLKGKRVFVRVDLNVPLDDTFKITDDTRIRAAVPTIKYLMSHGARVILSSHLGRPKGVTPKFSLKPLVPRLSELLGIEVKMADDCIGPDVEKLVAEIPEGGVLLLENVRFYKEEEKNDPEFAKKLASLADLYVNDAFGTAHRAHASTEGVAKHLKPAVAGFLVQKELDYLVGAVSNPKKPFAAIVGGSKVSSKIGVIESLLEKVDILVLGGGMIFTFYKAQGLAVGSSLVEEDKLDLATTLLEKAKSKGVSLLLPSDVVIADKFAADANSKIVPASSIPDGWMGLDIGPDSIKSFSEALDTTKTVIWNGPMGVFEFDKFAVGTEAIAKKLAELSGKGVTTIIGGGDSVAAVEKVGLADKMSHISTGGGASLELLEGKPLPGVLALDEA